MYHSSFASIESAMVHLKNHSGVDDIFAKRGDYVFLEGQNRNNWLYFWFYKNEFNSTTGIIIIFLKRFRIYIKITIQLFNIMQKVAL